MLAWALVFLLAALFSAIPGFSGGTDRFSLIAQGVFYVSMVLFFVAVGLRILKGRLAS